MQTTSMLESLLCSVLTDPQVSRESVSAAGAFVDPAWLKQAY